MLCPAPVLLYVDWHFTLFEHVPLSCGLPPASYCEAMTLSTRVVVRRAGMGQITVKAKVKGKSPETSLFPRTNMRIRAYWFR